MRKVLCPAFDDQPSACPCPLHEVHPLCAGQPEVLQLQRVGLPRHALLRRALGSNRRIDGWCLFSRCPSSWIRGFRQVAGLMGILLARVFGVGSQQMTTWVLTRCPGPMPVRQHLVRLGSVILNMISQGLSRHARRKIICCKFLVPPGRESGEAL